MIHGPEHPIGNIRWTGNLEKVAACMNHFGSDGLRSRIVHAGWTGKQQEAGIPLNNLPWFPDNALKL